MKKPSKIKKKYTYPLRQRLLIDRNVYDNFSIKVCALRMTKHPSRMATLIEQLMIGYILGEYDDVLEKKRFIKRDTRVCDLKITNSFVNRDLGIFFAELAFKEKLIKHRERSAGFIEYLMKLFIDGVIDIKNYK